jgi:methyl-accepting chemotaxis protein
MDIANGAEDAKDGVSDLSGQMEYNAESATIVAQSVMRMNNGIDKLADGLED